MVSPEGQNCVRVKIGYGENLSLEKTVYNSWSEYSKLMRMPFSQLELFWGRLDKQTKNSLLHNAKKSTKKGKDEASKIKEEVNTYPLQGPMGQLLGAPNVFRNRAKCHDVKFI